LKFDLGLSNSSIRRIPSVKFHLQSGPIKEKTLSILFIQSHVLLNSVRKMSEKLHKVSHKMLSANSIINGISLVSRHNKSYLGCINKWSN